MSAVKKFPDTTIIILAILLLFIGLTWIVPAGEFERTIVNERTVIVPNSYHTVEQQGQGFQAFITAPMRGFESAALIIGFIFLVGGAFSIVTRTGAIDAGLQRVIQFSKDNPTYKKWIIPLIITLFSLGGSTFGMCEEVMVFVLITIPLGIALGYDSMVGLAISFVGAGVGFAGAFINPFTIGIAQGIAELPPSSGMWYRVIVWCIMTFIAIVFIMNYANKVEKDKTKSVVYELDKKRDLSSFQGEILEFTINRKIVIGALVGALALLVIGVGNWHWYINEISGLFLGLGVVTALVTRMSVDEAIEAFYEGAKSMMVAAITIGLAKALIVVAEDGKIIDTMLHTVATSAEGLPKAISVEIMFVLQSFLNFFVPSGSGQAALTMPILAPLSDLMDISRQTAVLAYQFGDGLSNMVVPTSGVTMGILAIAKIPYNVWLKWMLPLFIILCITAMLLLLPPVFLFQW